MTELNKMKKGIVWAVFCSVFTIGFAGCSIRAMDVKTLTIQPQKDPVTVTAVGTATCQDYFLFFTVYEDLNMKSSDGQQAGSVKK
ncbi:MAG: hypothetical protein HZA00_15075 [Nitrospinae bacterium]|nr:hypothetical protein [Nitrospinota bacterium]